MSAGRTIDFDLSYGGIRFTFVAQSESYNHTYKPCHTDFIIHVFMAITSLVDHRTKIIKSLEVSARQRNFAVIIIDIWVVGHLMVGTFTQSLTHYLLFHGVK